VRHRPWWEALAEPGLGGGLEGAAEFLDPNILGTCLDLRRLPGGVGRFWEL
jgi:hypothetical protein